MKKLEELQKYLDYEFSSGAYTGEDYKTFQSKYIDYLRSVCKDNDLELVSVNKNHYEFSAFIKKQNKYVYFCISDVRFWQNDWYNRILIRIADNEKDYMGGHNYYIALPRLISMIDWITA